MKKEFKQLIGLNSAFVALYLFLNWLEYSSLNLPNNSLENSALRTNFPFNIEITTYHPQTGALILSKIPNLTLIVFLLALLVNIYIAYRTGIKYNQNETAIKNRK